MRLSLRVVWTFAAQIAVTAAGLLSSIMVARILGPSGKGAYSLAFQVSGFAVAFGGLGLDLAVIYYAGKETFAERDLKATLLWFGMAWGSVAGLATFGLTRFLNTTGLRGVPSTVLLPAILLIPFSLSLNYQRSFLLGRNRLMEYNGVGIFLAYATCLSLFVALVAAHTGLVGAVWACGVANLMALGLVLRLNRTNVTRLSGIKNTRILRHLVSFGLKPQLGNVLQLFSYRLDMFILNAFQGPLMVGYYSIAVMLAEGVWYIANAVSLVLLPQMVASNREDADCITPIICRSTVLLSLLAALGVAALAPLVITLLFSKAFLPAVVPLWCLLPGIVALSLDKPIASFQMGQGRPQISLYVVMLSAPVTLSVYALLIPRFGILGAAVGSSISYTVTTAFELYFLRRFSSIRLVELLVPQRSDWALYRSFLVDTKKSLTALKFRPPRTTMTI